ncbi:hypothetical protein BO94DRAFT_478862 [Aspergillus sclerotioniger CBS 115572]|uniref:Cell wall mannoprotein 1 n=1 Tax=Aspergillus sclerotioniger CBS 115572 TaxID=1450535 RepID=A0A317V475_9EURO|nr:hypothetical protein BO94DRAFT_478862 [Aspergillus sclerotioniger CBS 115572]PWY67602.1 hypothetical protein BO94DRAFT_478862 [Aspergillus sclerotioniger CBS 115572]
MRFAIASTALLTFLTLATSHVIKRDTDTVLGDLSAINTNLGTLSAAVYSYNGGLPAALEIQTHENAVERALEQATADTNSTAVFTAAESNTVTEALISLEPIIRGSIAALVTKRTLFVSAGVGATVRTNLQNLKVRTDNLSVALQSKAVGADKETIRQGTGDVDDAFDGAIDAYESQL